MSVNFNAPVGLPVQFFPGADENGDPVAAKITESRENGQVRIVLFRSGGGEVGACRGFVRHMSDPWIEDNKDKLKTAIHGSVQGAWDFIPGMRIIEKKATVKNEKKAVAAS